MNAKKAGKKANSATPRVGEQFETSATLQQSMHMAPRRTMGRSEANFLRKFMPAPLVESVRHSILRQRLTV